MDFISLIQVAENAKSMGVDALQKLDSLGYSFKNSRELSVFESLVKYIGSEKESEVYSISDNFIVGYNPENGFPNSQFDLLRLGDNYIINIELKEGGKTEEERVKQLNDHNFLLKLLRKDVYFFSYQESDDTLLMACSSNVDDDGKLIVRNCEPKELLDVMKGQVYSTTKRKVLDCLLSPKQYLVSPFNDTERFFKGEYLLTNSQSDIKAHIIKSDKKIYAIKGGAGTGKSLLLYDMAKELKENRQICVITCSRLSEGHKSIIAKGIHILPVNEIDQVKVDDHDYIFVDEFQRMQQEQRDKLIADIEVSSTKLVVFYDDKQTLSTTEEKCNNDKYMKKKEVKKEVYRKELDVKFRSNPNLIAFIDKILENSLKDRKSVKRNDGQIELLYCADASVALKYLEEECKEYKVLRYTGDKNQKGCLYPFEHNDENAHRLIGQEFSNVAIPINSSFYYEKRGEAYILKAKDRKYASVKMLYQNLTRAKDKLKLVVVGNKPLFDRIEFLLKDSE